jgi:hypothetical protein
MKLAKVIPIHEQLAAGAKGFRHLWNLAERYTSTGKPVEVGLITITKEQLEDYFQAHRDEAMKLLNQDRAGTHDVEVLDHANGFFRVYFLRNGKLEAVRKFQSIEAAAAEWALSPRWGISRNALEQQVR